MENETEETQFRLVNKDLTARLLPVDSSCSM